MLDFILSGSPAWAVFLCILLRSFFILVVELVIVIGLIYIVDLHPSLSCSLSDSELIEEFCTSLLRDFVLVQVDRL